MARAEGKSVLSGVRYREGCPLSSRLGDLGERHELPQRVPGQSPDRKPILAYFAGHRTIGVARILSGGALFLTKKVDDPFFSHRPQKRINTPPNLTRPAKTVLKIDSCSGWGFTSCPRGCAYTISR